MMGGRAGYRRFVLEGIKDGHREDYYRVEDQRFLGAEEFAHKLKSKVNEEEMPRRKKQLSVVFRNIARAVKVEMEVLEGADRGWDISQTRALVGYVLIRRLGYKLKDVAKLLGRDVATVSSLVSRFAGRMGENERLRKQTVRLLEDCQE
jgi:chromosomal replication initiation ATPase DnaA